MRRESVSRWRCGHVTWRDLMGVAGVWPRWFHGSGYAQLMLQLRDRRGFFPPYSTVHKLAKESDDATHFEDLLKVHLRQELDIDHDKISELWRRCKETPPGKHTLRG